MTDLAPTPLKACNKCGVAQDIEQFIKNKTYTSGRDNSCRECRRADKRSSYRRNSAKEPPAEKTCNICKKTYPGKFFPKSHSADGRQTFCRDCKGLQTKFRMYRISRDEFFGRLRAQGNGCAICGSSCELPSQYHVDHDHSCCPHGKSCGKCIRGLLCPTCNVLTLPGYEQMPSHLKRCPVLNKYLGGHRG